MADMSDTIHCRCSPAFKLEAQKYARRAGLSDGDYYRKAITLLNQQVQNKEIDQNDRTETLALPTD